MRPLNLESEGKTFPLDVYPFAPASAELETVTMRKGDVEALKREIRRLGQVLTSKERRFAKVNERLHRLEEQHHHLRQRFRDLLGYLRLKNIELPACDEADLSEQESGSESA